MQRDELGIRIDGSLRVAAGKLGFSYESYCSEDREIEFDGALGKILYFGSKKGTVVFHRNSKPKTSEIEKLQKEKYFFSVFYDSYSSYEENLYMDTLNDLGYFGRPEGKPIWYTGQQWS